MGRGWALKQAVFYPSTSDEEIKKYIEASTVPTGTFRSVPELCEAKMNSDESITSKDQIEEIVDEYTNVSERH